VQTQLGLRWGWYQFPSGFEALRAQIHRGYAGPHLQQLDNQSPAHAIATARNHINFVFRIHLEDFDSKLPIPALLGHDFPQLFSTSSLRFGKLLLLGKGGFLL
jgi:hypothetical protein